MSPASPASPALEADSLPLSHWGNPSFEYTAQQFIYRYILFHIFSSIDYYLMLSIVPCAKSLMVIYFIHSSVYMLILAS